MGRVINACAALVLCAFGLAAPASAQELMTGADGQRTITVSGRGHVNAVPDMAEISVGVSGQAIKARDAFGTVNNTMQAVLGRLADLGIKPRDIQTRDLRVQPEYAREASAKREIIGYTARNTAVVRVINTGLLGAVIDAAIGAEANEFFGIQFSLQNPKPLEDQARIEAVMQARSKARVYAEAAGVTLGPVLSIREVGTSVQRPNQFELARSAEAIATDEVGVSAGVTLVYAIE